MCGASLEGRRRQTETCGDRCRQRLWRLRRAERLADAAPTAPTSSEAINHVSEGHRPQLTPELRLYLKREIARLTSEQEQRRREADRCLFADEVRA